MNLIFKSTFQIESEAISAESGLMSDDDLIENIEEQLRLGFEAIERNLQDNFGRYADLRITYDI